MGFIYLIKNEVNGKMYVGQTKRTPEIRFKRHCSKQYSHEDNMAIKRAILKYGKENFSLSTLEECDNSILDDREIYWISYYDTYNNGYNLTTGGNFGATRKCILNEEDQLKVCELYESGKSSYKIANEFGCSQTAIAGYLRKHSIELSDKRLLEHRINFDEFKEYILKENPTPSIAAKRFNINKSAAYYILKKIQINNPEIHFRHKPDSWAKQIDEIDKDELMSLYKQGIPIRDLAVRFHIQKKKISDFINQFAPKGKRVNFKNIEYNSTTSVRALTDNAEG